MTEFSPLQKLVKDPQLDSLLKTMEKPVGSMHYDPWGYNRDISHGAISLFRWLYEKYFRVQTHGLENIPASGPCLVIANHSGQLPIDAALLGYALATNPHGPRAPRAMMERFLPTVPFIGNLLNQIGAVVGDPVNCSRMLEAGEAILVFPEGVRGAGKPWRLRYQLQRFGHGFMHLAIEHQVPIIPVGIVGCEETIPALTHSKLLARLSGLPYVPIAPPVVLPARVYMRIGKPLHFSGDGDARKITQQVETVKDVIRTLIQEGLDQREGVF